MILWTILMKTNRALKRVAFSSSNDPSLSPRSGRLLLKDVPGPGPHCCSCITNSSAATSFSNVADAPNTRLSAPA